MYIAFILKSIIFGGSMELRINNVYDQLSKTERQIAKYFLEHENEIISMSIYEVAEDVGVSSATLSRFVKKVFGKNYAQTKIEIAKLNQQREFEKGSAILDWATDYHDIHNKIIYHIEKVCRDVIAYNEASVFETAYKKIAEAENVYLFGMGNSGTVAQDFGQKLIKLKKRVIYWPDFRYAMTTSLTCTQKDVVIAISVTGKTDEVNLAVKKAKEKGAHIIAITSGILNDLYKMADTPIVLPNVENRSFRLAPVFSRYSQLFVIDMLFIGLAKMLGDDPETLLREYINLFDELDIMHARKKK